MKQFGPTLNRVPAGGWVASEEEEDEMVKTYCCFCGQQCGIQLRVRDNKVVGWEPWEDFPFNLGKLCPKGVKRYMQDEHPDRLKHPLQRVTGKGFEQISWDAALSRVVIRKILFSISCHDSLHAADGSQPQMPSDHVRERQRMT
ncbi:MAG: hypothetical protein WCC92_09095 [Candidatus Korobacteraceae bacterium]